MRAKTVNESKSGGVSYREAIQFAKKIAGQNSEKIMGPSVKERYNSPGEYYVQTGGVSREYDPKDLDELLFAMEIVENNHHNVIWTINPGHNFSSAEISFISDEERSTGELISKYYNDKNGKFTGD